MIPEIYCVWLAQDLENQGLWHIKYAKKKYRYNYYDNGEIVKEAHRKLYNHLDTETEEYNEPFNTKKTNSFYKLAKMFEDIDVSAL